MLSKYRMGVQQSTDSWPGTPDSAGPPTTPTAPPHAPAAPAPALHHPKCPVSLLALILVFLFNSLVNRCLV